ncbi:glycosyltransferase family 2 protein [Paenibacillus sp. HW567]|uniref:glycosyltransferase family 2 protein n=1 Tax=Paenibacillus sp. HW567 TaxID=1034769 RepID=UPI000365E6CA|nr:glycosyltransferase [Paenibacillus sp. HW567]
MMATALKTTSGPQPKAFVTAKSPVRRAGAAPSRRSRTGAKAAGRRKAAQAAAIRPAGRANAGAAALKSAVRRRAAAGATDAGNAHVPRREEKSLPSLRGTLSVIISARNEEQTLPPLLKQVMRLNPAEIIVVLNGCTDNSFQHSRLCKIATVIHCPESAGHDVGRALGAKLSRGDILLFLDGDMTIPASQLVSFAAAVDDGVDVALNDLDALLPSFELSDDVTRCKMYLNAVLGRSDLGVSSMTAVPHALSRHALERIGYRELMVPPKAQAISIMEKLRVEKAGTVNVITNNRIRQGNTGAGNAMEQLIAGDHAEALRKVLMQREADGLVTGESLLEQRRQMAAWRNRI